MNDHTYSVHSLDEALLRHPSNEVLEASLYASKKAELDDQDSIRLTRLELAAKKQLAALERDGEFSNINESNSYYDCFPIAAADGTIRSYFNQTLLRFTFLDFSLSDPSGGGIVDLDCHKSRIEGSTQRRNSQYVPTDGIAASTRSSGSSEKLISENRSQRYLINFKNRKLAPLHPRSEEFYRGFAESIPQDDANLYRPLLNFLWKHETMPIENTFSDYPFEDYGISTVMRVALGITAIAPCDLPEWSNFKRSCKSPKELENNFARRLLLVEALGEMSSKLCDGKYLNAVGAVGLTEHEARTENAAFRRNLVEQLVGVTAFLNRSADPSFIEPKSAMEEKFFKLAQDGTRLHLFLSSLLLSLTRIVHADCQRTFASSGVTNVPDQFMAKNDIDRRRRLGELSTFIGRFTWMSGVERRWFSFAELSQTSGFACDGHSELIDDQTLQSLSTFGSITLQTCTWMYILRTEEKHLGADRKQALRTLERCGLEVLALEK